jgi:Flp pilus assembly protein TadG
MIIVRANSGKDSYCGRRRGFAVSTFFLFAAPIFLIALIFAVNAAYLAQARANLHTSADAAALAAVQTLVDDSWLTQDPTAQMNLIAAARVQAQNYGAANKVLGAPLKLHVPTSPTTNHPLADIVFGYADQPRNPDPTQRILFVNDLDGNYNGAPLLPLINTVRINARRNKFHGNRIHLIGGQFTGIDHKEALEHSTATLDRDVIGFQPQGGQDLPMVPLALYTNPAPATPSSWDNQLQLGSDIWKFNPASGTFVPGSDQLFEVTLLVSGDETQASAALLLLGIADLAAAGNQATYDGQIVQGVSTSDLQGLGGAFVLASSNNLLTVAATRGDNSFYSDLANQLNIIAGQKKIWPLYEGFDPGTGQAVIAGFVAARVVQANVTSNGVAITLQPCMLSTRTALTNVSQRGVGGVNITNPYICKVRLVE